MSLIALSRSVVLTIGMVLVSGPAHGAVRELPVPRVTINAKEVITPDSITARQFRTTEASIRGIALMPGDVVGLEARRRLVAGKPIPLSALRRPLLISRGQRVEARFQGGGFAISGLLVALEEGAAGDTIPARNPDTGIVVRASVAADGTLRVDER